MAISGLDARGRFTKTLIDVYQERIRPTAFLRSFFPTETAPTKEISIEVERGYEKVAVDVFRGTEGNRNSFSRSTEKIFEPPLYREYFDATQLDLYDRVLGSQGNAQVPLYAALMNKIADRLGLLQDKIERAIELQCAQILFNGIVNIKSGVNIDFKRKSTSFKDLGGGNYFANNVDPFGVFETGANFLRQVGKSGDGTFNAICGSTALADLLANTKFTTRQNLFNMALDQVIGPVRGASGMTFHGTITAGAYKIQLWAYPQFYDDATSGVSTPYVPANKITLIPSNPKFKTAFAAVPQLIGEPGQLPVQGDFIVGEFIDTRRAAHDFDIQSAPIALPVAVDQIYTVQVSA